MPENWFTNEAISNYITFAAGIIVAIVGFVIRERIQKKRPSVVVVTKERETSLLYISAEARKQLRVTYNDQVVSEFYQTTFDIVNQGEHPIQDIEIVFRFEGESDTIISATNRPASSAKREVRIARTEKEVLLSIPYLNPNHDHGDFENLQLYSSKPIKNTNVLGGGVGWSIKYLDRPKNMSELEALISESPVLAALLELIRFSSRLFSG